MIAQDIQTFLRSLNGGWVDEENTVDTFKAGSWDEPVRGIAVGWMSYTQALQQAIERGCNVFITHEPTYYDHFDTDRWLHLPGTAEKKALIEANRLVIIRCHDLWDQMPQTGITDSWARLLGLGEPIERHEYTQLFNVQGQTVGELAQHIARSTAALGQPGVQLIGSPAQPVSRLCIGTGAITPYFEAVLAHQADVMLCTDDGMVYWRDAAYAIDMNLPILVVNHAVSELAGIAALAQTLQRAFPQVPVHWIEQSCMYRWITA